MAKSDTVDFTRYLNVSMDDVPATIPSLPRGHFFADITGWKTGERFYQGKANPGTPVVEISFRVTAPDSDVEEEGNWVGKVASKDYTLNDPDRTGQTMIRQLAERTCGLDVKGLQLTDVLDALKGQPVKIFNEPRAGQEEGQTFTKITRVLSADS